MAGVVGNHAACHHEEQALGGGERNYVEFHKFQEEVVEHVFGCHEVVGV